MDKKVAVSIKKIFVVINLFLILLFYKPPIHAASPSFDCLKASNVIERRICSSDQLSLKDRKLSKLYKTVLTKASAGVKLQFKKEQRAWLKKRNAACQRQFANMESCLLEQYQQRNETLSSLLAYDSSKQANSSELKVLRITPKGNDVAAGKQIVFQFDRPVVPIGRMERNSSDIPVEITPKLNCEWRWLNTSALACQLRDEDKMKKATRYDVTLDMGLSTEDGVGLSESISHTFTTTRPKIKYSRFKNWLSPGAPIIQVTFNQPVTKSSVESVLTMHGSIYGPVSIVAHADMQKRRLPYWLAITNEKEQPLVDDRKTGVNGDTARRVWLIEPKQELSLNTKIQIRVAPGLISSEGKESGIEYRTFITFLTYPEFKFLGLRCTPEGERRSQIMTYNTLKDMADGISVLRRCAPLKNISLMFSAPVLNSAVKNNIEFKPALNGDRKDYDPWENRRDWTSLTRAHYKNRTYQVSLPERLKAYKNYEVVVDQLGFKDEFGRSLKENVKFKFKTAHRAPNLRLNHNVAVLEKGVDSDVPLYVTNLNNVTVSYDKINKNKKIPGLSEQLKIPSAQDVSYSAPMGVRKLVDGEAAKKSGIIYGSVHPDPVPPNWYRDPKILAQVTPYQVHVKVGHFNSLVWVTEFATGKPVSGASIQLMKGNYQSLPGLQATFVSAKTNDDGIAEFAGLSEIDPDLYNINQGTNERRQGFFVQVTKDEDIALVPLNYQFMVRANGAWPWLKKKGGHTHSWGMTAQGVYKLGDKIEFKIYVRDQSNKHWVKPVESLYNLAVYDPQNKIVFEKKEIELNKFGSFSGDFKVPEQGAVGRYRFKLTPNSKTLKVRSGFTWTPMSVLVSDFTPSPFKVSTELNGKLFSANDSVQVSSLATMFSGGPFSGADVRLTARLKIKPFKTNNPLAKDFSFGGSSGKYLNRAKSKLLDVRAKLNDKGEYEESFTAPETDIYYGSLMVESAVKDERGKYVASSVRADYAGRSRFVGLKNTQWLYEKGKKSALETLVVDQKGEVAAGVDINIDIQHRVYKASRVKGPGNAYLTQNIMTWEKESSCAISSKKAAARCEFTPKHPGYYQFIASIKDKEGRTHSTTLNGWVIGQGNVVWNLSNDASLEIIPEQTDYKIGDTARYLVKNPFPGAKALITVERYGVLDSWTQVLDGSTPVIEVKIKPDYVPGFYLSVMAVSPRVEKPMGAGKVDLGKPSYRMGYVTAKVSDPYKQLDISVETDKAEYKPRDKVKAKIAIKSKLKNNEPYEIAVAVIDESVLALNKSGKKYYDPYHGFNKLDSLDVSNYSLISRLVGRQKFEKKGANPGGGGGASGVKLRNLFKFVSYWNPSIDPGSDGKAEIEFTVPDNLTGWRILAFAVTPNDQMGLGDSNIKVNRPTELRPVMPNQVIEGDQFKAGFNVMNRTGKARVLTFDINVKGPLHKESKSRFKQTISVPAYKRKNVWFPIKTKGFGDLVFTAKSGDKIDADAIVHKVVVNKRRSLETAANYGTSTADKMSDSVKVPKGIYTDVGDIGVVLSPTVIGNIDGAFKYVKNYPHLCWEQRLTKAVVATSYIELKDYFKKDIEWNEAASDIKSVLERATNFQAPNGGMVYWVPQNKSVSPYLSAYTAMAFNWLRRDGYEIPTTVENRLHEYLLNLLKRDEFPSFYNKGMSSSVRAVALAALSENGKITKDDVNRYQQHLPEMDLFGKSHFLQAAIKAEGVENNVVTGALDSILGHSSQTGGKFQFNEAWDDSYKYLLATPLRSNCSILSSLLVAQKESLAGSSVGDIPFKMVRTITQSRGNRDHWENTQENVFCLNAIVDYAKMYEVDDPKMKVSVEFDKKKLGNTLFKNKTDKPVTISRPLTKNDVGKSAKLEITKQGKGRLYYSTRLSYDLKEDNASRINSGIEIRREYSVERNGKFEILKSPMKVKRGEIIKVNLFVSVPSARHFVAVNDPIPGGLEPVNTQLATASIVDAEKSKLKMAEESWFYKISNWSYYGRYFWSFYHKELRHDSARFYADYLPAGNYQLAYTAQVIAEGQFSVMPVHAEEMYDADVYGKGLPATLSVGE